jgi:adenylate cyclase
LVPEAFRAVQWTCLPRGETPPSFVQRVFRLLSPDPSPAASPTISRRARTPALPDKPSIAVLPFADMTGEQGRDYFVEGMVDEITTALSRFSSLFVIANSSTLAYRGEARNLQQIAAELGVRYLLEGSVRQAGDQVRISVKLTDAVDMLPFWNHRFEGIKADAFALQDQVANSIAAQIEPHIEDAELRRVSAHPAPDPGPYELYLRALHGFRRYSKEGNSEALTLLERAIALDPSFAPALELASLSHTFSCINGWSDDLMATRDLGQELSRRALLHNPKDPRVLVAAAMAATFLGDDLDMAARLVDRSLAINPNSVVHLILRGWIKLLRGDGLSALAEIDAVTHLDPQVASSSFALLLSGYCYISLQRFEESLAAFRESAHRGQANDFLRFGDGVALAHSGRLTEARQAHATVNPRLVPYYTKLFRGPNCGQIMLAALALIEDGRAGVA